MSTDAFQSVAAIASVGMITAGCWLAWGCGYGLIALGGLLLSGIIYARTRGHADQLD